MIFAPLHTGFMGLMGGLVGGAYFVDATCDTHAGGVADDVTCDSSALIKVGLGVTGTGIPTGTYVKSIITGSAGTNVTKFELSNDATGGALTNTELTFRVITGVGTTPPVISLQPLGDTGISVGDRVELVITAAAGTGALTEYALYKNGILLRVEATAVTTKTFVIDSFKTTNEGEYFIRVTQANGAYKTSDKVELRLYHVNADGSQKPVIETKTTQDVSTIPTVGGSGVLTGIDLVEVDGWQYIYESKIFGHQGAVNDKVKAEAKKLADQYYPGGPGSVTVNVLKSAAGFYGEIWTPDP